MQRPMSQAALLAAMLRERFGTMAQWERERYGTRKPRRVERPAVQPVEPAPGEWSGT